MNVIKTVSLLLVCLLFALPLTSAFVRCDAAENEDNRIYLVRMNNLWGAPTDNMSVIFTKDFGKSVSATWWNKLAAEYDEESGKYIVKEKAASGIEKEIAIPENGFVIAFIYTPFGEYYTDIAKANKRTFDMALPGDKLTVTGVDYESRTLDTEGMWNAAMFDEFVSNAYLTLEIDKSTRPVTPLSDKTIVCFGDSVTQNGGWTDMLAMEFGSTVINAGVGGDTTSDALARFDTDVAKYSPDIVFVDFGLNDQVGQKISPVKYKENLLKIYNKCAAINAEVVFITPNYHNNTSFETANPEKYTKFGGALALLDNYYIKAMRETALECGCDIVDMRAECNKYEFTDILCEDGLHPNNTGYELCGNSVISYLTAKHCLCDSKTVGIEYIDTNGNVIAGTDKLNAAQGASLIISPVEIKGYDAPSNYEELIVSSDDTQTIEFIYTPNGKPTETVKAAETTSPSVAASNTTQQRITAAESTNEPTATSIAVENNNEKSNSKIVFVLVVCVIIIAVVLSAVFLVKGKS